MSQTATLGAAATALSQQGKEQCLWAHWEMGRGHNKAVGGRQRETGALKHTGGAAAGRDKKQMHVKHTWHPSRHHLNPEP